MLKTIRPRSTLRAACVAPFVLGVALILLTGCGGGGGGAAGGVPEWMWGDWWLVRYGLQNWDDYNYHVMFTATGVTYTMGECVGAADITMDTSIPFWAGNDYTMTVTKAENCAGFEYEALLGAVDKGVIWAVEESGWLVLYRITSVQSPYRWVYIRPLESDG